MTATINKTIVSGREIIVYLPPAYEMSKKKFSVVYIHDGGDLLYGQVDKVTALVTGGKLAQLIFVGIATSKRLEDYTPWPAAAIAAERSNFGGKGADYLAFVANELKPYIDGKYRTCSSPEHTGIIGASLGGLISLYALYLYPEVFGKIGVISGSFWYEGFVEFMAETQLRNKKGRIYMDVGSKEGLGKSNIQKEMISRTKSAYKVLLSKGIPADNCRLIFNEGGTHDQSCFLSRFPDALHWLFPKEHSDCYTE